MSFSRVTTGDIAADLSEELEMGGRRTAMTVRGVCPSHAGHWGGGGHVESRCAEPLLWDQRPKGCTLESFRGRLCLIESE